MASATFISMLHAVYEQGRSSVSTMETNITMNSYGRLAANAVRKSTGSIVAASGDRMVCWRHEQKRHHILADYHRARYPRCRSKLFHKAVARPTRFFRAVSLRSEEHTSELQSQFHLV